MNNVKALQGRGHKVIILTRATYSFVSVTEAFVRRGVQINRLDYYNRKHRIKAKVRRKCEFIDMFKTFDKRCLHVDNLLTCESSSTHFYHAWASAPFP